MTCSGIRREPPTTDRARAFDGLSFLAHAASCGTRQRAGRSQRVVHETAIKWGKSDRDQQTSEAERSSWWTRRSMESAELPRFLPSSSLLHATYRFRRYLIRADSSWSFSIVRFPHRSEISGSTPSSPHDCSNTYVRKRESLVEKFLQVPQTEAYLIHDGRSPSSVNR